MNHHQNQQLLGFLTHDLGVQFYGQGKVSLIRHFIVEESNKGSNQGPVLKGHCSGWNNKHPLYSLVFEYLVPASVTQGSLRNVALLEQICHQELALRVQNSPYVQFYTMLTVCGLRDELSAIPAVMTYLGIMKPNPSGP